MKIRVNQLLATSVVAFVGASFAQGGDITWPPPTAPDNAALVYHRAFLLLSPLSLKENEAADKAFEKLAETGEYDARALDPFVERNSKPLALLLQGAAIDRCDFGMQFDQGTSAAWPELSRIRELAREGIIAMAQARDKGDSDRMAALFGAILKLARSAHEEGTMVSALVGVAVIDMVSGQTGRLLGALPAENAATYERMERALDEVTPAVSNWASAIEGEMKMYAVYYPPPGTVLTREQLMRFKDIAAASKAQGNEAVPTPEEAVRIIQGTASQAEREKAARFLECSPDDLTSPEKMTALLTHYGMGLMRMLREIQGILALPYPVAQPKFAEVLKRAETEDEATRTFIPPMAAVVFYKAKEAAQLGMMRTALAIVKWQAAQGRLPENLEKILPAVSADPFTEAQPFEYRRLQSGGFSLSSKGTAERDVATPLVMTVPMRP